MLPNDMELPENSGDSATTFQSLIEGQEVTLSEDYELGGVAIQDPSQGLQVRVWRAYIVQAKYIYIDSPGVAHTAWYESETNSLTEVSLSFDQNMRPVLAFVENFEAKFQWYDTVTETQIITNLGSNVISPRVSLDEKRQFFGQVSDVLLCYIRDGNLCLRQQRDRYGVEYIIAPAPEGYYIHKVGMSTGLRFQWEFRRIWPPEQVLATLLSEAPAETSEGPYTPSAATAITFDSDASTIYSPDNEQED